MSQQGQVPEKSVSSDDIMNTDPIQPHKGSMSSNGDDSSNHSDSDDNPGIKFEDWGFQVDRLFDVAYRFYKRNESKAFYPTYEERNQLIALILQARYGNFDGGKAPDVGALDLVGRSRRQHWATLKGMSKTEAMSKFIFTLNELCPFFKAHVEAVKISCDVQAIVDNGQPSSFDEQQIPSTTSNSIKKDEKLEAIYTSLCRQTYQQFKGYAMKQYPTDVQERKYLISSLQEQYYQQYISQMHPDLNHNSSSRDQLKSSLSPAASETASSIMQDNGDNVSTISTKTIERDSNVDIDIHNSTPSQDNHTDQLIDNSKPSEIHTLINTEKDYSPIPIVGDRHETSNPLFETTNPVTNNGFSLNGSNIQHVKQKIQHQSNISQISNNVSVTKPESPLPEPNPYQPIDLHSIGKFEAFPKPKPISRYPQPVNIAEVAAKVITTEIKDQREAKPAYTTIDLGEEEPPTMIVEPPDAKPTLPPQELPTIPPQELPPLPSSLMDQESRAFNPLSEIFQQTRTETCLSNDLNNQHTLANEESSPVVIPENQQPKEYWDGDGSSSSSCDDSPLEHSVSYEPIEPATIWTKRGGYEFKESLVDDKHGGLYVVKQGTLVTIQVPTYPDGRYIYWEFATEDYDIGFGLDFVYETNLMEPLAIKIYEETDEDHDEDTDELVDGTNTNRINDPELAVSDGQSRDLCLMEQEKAERITRLANTVSIIPTYRRDSHEEIFVGRHKYPGRGYYQLKFDNTYSVLRSKTILFRICYFI